MELGDILLVTMSGAKGLPCSQTVLARPSGSCSGSLGLAELGTVLASLAVLRVVKPVCQVQLELRQLAVATGQPK